MCLARLYRPGQALTAEDILPNQVVVILEGRARLLTRDGTKQRH